MEIRFEGQLTQQDLNRAFWLHFRPGWGLWLTAALIGAPSLLLLAFAGGTNLAIGLAGESAAEMPAPVLLIALVPLAIAALIAAAPALLARYSARGAFRANRELHTPIRGTVTPEGVCEVTLHSEADIAWKGFHAYRRSGDLVALYLSQAGLQVYPRRFFSSDADWTAFNEMVAARVRPMARAVASQRKWSRRLTLAVVVLMVIGAVVSFLLQRP